MNLLRSLDAQLPLEVTKAAKPKLQPLTRAEKFRLLLAFLKRLTPAQVKLDYILVSDKRRPDTSCQTSGCVMGWATMVPEFRARGFRPKSDFCPGTTGHAFMAAYKGNEDFAAGKFFDVGHESDWLFAGQGGPMDPALLARIRRRRHGKPIPDHRRQHLIAMERVRYALELNRQGQLSHYAPDESEQ